jgi:hypothetical protein
MGRAVPPPAGVRFVEPPFEKGFLAGVELSRGRADFPGKARGQGGRGGGQRGRRRPGWFPRESGGRAVAEHSRVDEIVRDAYR